MLYIMKEEEVQKLAHLARIKLGKGEASSLTVDLEKVLQYVSQLSSVSGKGMPLSSTPNVFREDVSPHESGVYSLDLLSAVPKGGGGYIRVGKVIKGK